MKSDKTKNYIIIVLVIIALVLLALVLYFAFRKDEKIFVTGSVIASGDGYVIVEAKNTDYLLDTKDEYQIGDVLQIKVEKLDKKAMPIVIEKGEVSVVEEAKQEAGNSFFDGILEIKKDDAESKTEETIMSSQSSKSASSSNTSLDNSNFSGDNETEEITPTDFISPKETETNQDEIVLTYLNELSDINPKKEENTFKKGFITVIDFLFYGGDIKGVTLSDITTKTKLTVLKYALTIDKKVDEYFPDYKERISNTTSKVYTSVKNKIVTTYLDTTARICASNAEVCTSAKQDFQSMKTSFGITWTFLKNLASSGLSSLKDWYEIYSGK